MGSVIRLLSSAVPEFKCSTNGAPKLQISSSHTSKVATTPGFLNRSLKL
ncbi:hypothetical protein CCACVL1_17604 [Corchorus capsularis]|uniref:Uncharacterized protein n=1 Tax=Corchorus capsularis TaxID=210143 RepID=A0A1R3HQV5_COCAP|nr:hypothetical protein CCACVL1_17604 [Corchorus capsularis]